MQKYGRSEYAKASCTHLGERGRRAEAEVGVAPALAQLLHRGDVHLHARRICPEHACRHRVTNGLQLLPRYYY